MWVVADTSVVPSWDAMSVRGQGSPQVMPFVGLPGPHAAPPDQREIRDSETPVAETARFAMTALMLLPGALIIFTGFNAGATFRRPPPSP